MAFFPFNNMFATQGPMAPIHFHFHFASPSEASSTLPTVPSQSVHGLPDLLALFLGAGLGGGVGSLANNSSDAFSQFWANAMNPQAGAAPKPTVSAEVFARLPTEKLAAPVTCVICQEDMAVGDPALRLPCQHAFHSECLTPWLQQHAQTCPCCRLPITAATVPDAAKAAAEAQRQIEVLAAQAAAAAEKRAKYADVLATSQEVQTAPAEPACALQKLRPCACAAEDRCLSLDCGHSFHEECLDDFCRVAHATPFAKGTVVCPTCRSAQAHPRLLPLPAVADSTGCHAMEMDAQLPVVDQDDADVDECIIVDENGSLMARFVQANATKSANAAPHEPLPCTSAAVLEEVPALAPEDPMDVITDE